MRVPHEEDPGRSGAGRGHRLAEGPRGFRSHHPVKETRRVRLAGFVVENQDDAARDVRALPIAPPVGGRLDAEAREGHGSLRFGGWREPLGVEALPKLDGSRDLAEDFQPVSAAERAVRETVPLKVRTAGRLQTGAGVTARDELGGESVFGSLAEPSLHAVGGEEEQIGAQVGRSDGVDFRRRGTLALTRRQCGEEKPDRGQRGVTGTGEHGDPSLEGKRVYRRSLPKNRPRSGPGVPR